MAEIDYDAEPLPVLLEHLRSDIPRHRADAACAIGDRLRTREVAALGVTERDALSLLLGDAVAGVRVEAAIALAEARDARALPVLTAELQTRTFRLDAIRALGTLGDRGAIPPLGRWLRGFWVSWADRLQAAAALTALGSREGQDYLEARLASRRHAERAAAIHFLGEARHPRAFELLVAILGEASDPHRDVAVRSLGWLGDERATSALRAAASGADKDLAADIDEALEKLARRQGR